MLQWFIAHTKPHQERQAAAFLNGTRLEAYLPLLPNSNKTARRGRDNLLFPGYLFARLDVTADDWLQARSAPGISYFLGSGSAPTSVPDDLVAEIRTRVAERERRRREPRFQAGERVRIIGGAFDGLEAVFVGQLSAAGRSRVLVEVVSRLVPTEIDDMRLSQLHR